MNRKYDRDVRKKTCSAAREETRCAMRRQLEQKFAAFCARTAPPGVYWERELKWVWGGIIATISLTLTVFLVRCLITTGNLFETKWVIGPNGAYEAAGYGVKDGAMMMEVSELLDGNRIGFAMVAVLPVIFAINHYRYYRQGSMSVYLMKRLPDRWEYHRRNLMLPMILLMAVLVSMLLTELMCYGMYLLITPAGCLPAGQWTEFWKWMIGGGL